MLHGEALLSNTIAASRRTAEAIDQIPGCRVVGDEEIGRPGVADRDPLRIVIDVRGTGATGYEMAAALRSNFDTQVELATQATIVLVLGLDEMPRELERFVHDLTSIVDADGAPGRDRGGHARHRHVRERGRDARRARPSSARPTWSPSTTPSAASAPRRSPATRPASPCCCRASGSPTDVIEYLRSLKAVGARLHGASDPDFGDDLRRSVMLVDDRVALAA